MEKVFQLYVPIIAYTDNDTTRNTKLEFWIKNGSNYYPGNVGSEPANGYTVTLSSTTLERPINLSGFDNIADFCAELKSKMQSVSSPPAGFVVNFSASETTGYLTITSNYQIKLNMKLSTDTTTILEGMANELGFDPDSYTSAGSNYATSHTGTTNPPSLFSTSFSASCGLTMDDELLRFEQTDEFTTLSGLVVPTYIGTPKTSYSVAIEFMDQSQKSTLLAMWSKLAKGFPCYMYMGTFDWDVAYQQDFNAYLSKDFRSQLQIRRVEPGLSLWNAELGFISKTG